MKNTSPFRMLPTTTDAVENRLRFADFPSLGQAIRSVQAPGAKGLRILDAGCGPGNLAAFCEVQADWRLFGVDLWPNQLRQAAEKQRYEALFQVNLVDGLPFLSESFDIVVCNEVLMYLPDATKALTEFHRVLSPQGKLFVYNPIGWLPRLQPVIKKLARKIYRERRTIALDIEFNWKDAERACRITYYSLQTLIEQIRSVDFDISGFAAFRLFRNRIRLMSRLENLGWYRRMVLFLAARYPYLASDLLVVAYKKAISEPKPLSLDKFAA